MTTATLTAETITDDDIRALRAEAQAAGDDAQAQLCTAALSTGNDWMRARCVDAILAARAMVDA